MGCEYGTNKTCDCHECSEPCDYAGYYGYCDEKCEKYCNCNYCEYAKGRTKIKNILVDVTLIALIVIGLLVIFKDKITMILNYLFNI